MPRCISILTCLLFCFWLLPLGIFIKPSAEKMACNGQRAICMCSHTEAAAKAVPAAGDNLKSAGQVPKESVRSAGSGAMFALFLPAARSGEDDVAFAHRQLLLAAASPFLRSIDHVPKA